MCDTIKRTLKNKTKVDAQMKFYKTIALGVAYVTVKHGSWCPGCRDAFPEISDWNNNTRSD